MKDNKYNNLKNHNHSTDSYKKITEAEKKDAHNFGANMSNEDFEVGESLDLKFKNEYNNSKKSKCEKEEECKSDCKC